MTKTRMDPRGKRIPGRYVPPGHREPTHTEASCEAASSDADRRVAWVAAGGNAEDSLRVLRRKWHLQRISLLSQRGSPELQPFRVGILDLGGSLRKRVVELVRAHRHMKWIALVQDGMYAHDELRELIETFCFDVHSTPVADARLEATLDRAFESARQEARLRRTALERQRIDGTPMIGASAPMKELHRLLSRAASSDVPVLLLGENGTGKELAARTLHRGSPRAARPFVVINCAALSSQLIRSELFGYEERAFTVASERKPGRLELATGGTLLLDDVGRLDPEVQIELLAFLREGTFRRVGGLEPVGADVRVVATSTMDLAAAVESGQFREDLYYRLNVIQVNVPPLRDRGMDAMRLARHFLKRHCSRRRFTRASVAAMLQYHWPGNVRELVNRVQRASMVADGHLVQPKHLGLPERLARADKRQPTLAEARARAEREAIQEALSRSAHNVARAARQLGIGRVTLYRLIGKHGISLQRQC